jgi:three-Cys-motif partner protein
MSKIRTTVWKLDPHGVAKHAVLRRYLQAWIPIMASWSGRVLYIDGFAGPGIYEGGEEGSPIIALRAALAQAGLIRGEMNFLFIEADPPRHGVLRQEIAKLPMPSNLRVHVECARFDETVNGILDDLDAAGDRLIPTFAFVDPFGFSHTPMRTLARIMQHPRCEVLVTFMYEEINRFLGHADHPATFDALFGCPDWSRCLAHTDPWHREQCIQELYRQQLQRVVRIQFVRAFKMRNQDDRTDYFLFFGTNGLKGLAKMKEAMWRVDESGRFEFSDATDPTQVVLFEPGPDFADLHRRIRDGLTGKTMSVEEVETFVLVETPYRETHYKRVLKQMEVNDPPGVVVREAKKGRKRGQSPPGTVMEFLS